MNIGDICSRSVVTIGTDAPVPRAAELMRRHHVGTLVVTQYAQGGDRPVGMLTDRDIVIGVVAKEVAPESLTVRDIMSSEPLVAEEDDDIGDVLDDMRKEGIRRIPVVDRHGLLVGVFALDDLVQLIATQLASIAHIVGSQRGAESRTRV